MRVTRVKRIPACVSRIRKRSPFPRIFRPLWNERGVKSVCKPVEPLVISVGSLTRVFTALLDVNAAYTMYASRRARVLPEYAQKTLTCATRRRRGAAQNGTNVQLYNRNIESLRSRTRTECRCKNKSSKIKKREPLIFCNSWIGK